MDLILAGILFFLGLAGGLMSGLLGIGGGVIMVPLLLYIPPLMGIVPLSMKLVAGITTVQSFAAGVVGSFGHNRYKRVNKKLVLILAIPMAISAFVGSYFSKYFSNDFLLITFAGMAAFSSLLIFLPKKEDSNTTMDDEIKFNHFYAILIAVIIGFLSGIIGQGGAFIYLPAMLYLLHIPTRITIGSGLAIGVIASSSVLIGRISTNQISWVMALILVAGVIIGAYFGSVFSQRTPKIILRRILSLVVFFVALKIGWEVIINNLLL